MHTPDDTSAAFTDRRGTTRHYLNVVAESEHAGLPKMNHMNSVSKPIGRNALTNHTFHLKRGSVGAMPNFTALPQVIESSQGSILPIEVAFDKINVNQSKTREARRNIHI